MAMAGETEDAGSTVTVKYGDVAVVGNANSFLLLDGVSYSVSATASVSGYSGVALTQYTPVNGENTISLVLKHFTVIAPAGSVVSAGTLNGSFGYNFSTPISVVTEGSTVIYKFAPLSYNAFIRVQRPNDPDAVTYWEYETSKADGQTITVTEEMLFMKDNGDFDSNTVYRNFEKYALDLGDIYMNINPKGYIDLDVGDTKQLNVFRNWQAIESFTNAKIALPDFSYEIITLEGNNVVTIEPNANNSAMAMLTAKNEGTVIVLVTYDAMYSELTATGAGGGAGGANRLSAIWPDRTGVFVVSVGKDGSAITTNMTCNGKAFDAEHSPQFYTGTAGASVSFKPEDGCSVTVNRSTVGTETLSFGAFTADGVTVAQDGTVTVSGLTTGRHIIRVEKDGIYTYQVVTAQQGILGTEVLTITGSAGSSYMNKFWGYDENLNYYLNHQYPTYPGTTIGATSDRIVLSDGDIVTVGHFENWAFYDDPTSVFNYITVSNGDTTVAKNESITLQVFRAGADMGNGGSNTPVQARLDVYYAKAGAMISGDVTAWTKLGTTDAEGKLTVTLDLIHLKRSNRKWYRPLSKRTRKLTRRMLPTMMLL